MKTGFRKEVLAETKTNLGAAITSALITCCSHLMHQ
jgi:hypothetical protein